MEILDYRKYTKLLRRSPRAVSFDDLSSEQFHKNIAEMETLLKQDGVGLAASQVGWDVKLFLLCIDEKGNPAPTKVFLNPTILTSSKATEKLSEGCLSFPDLYLDIKRPLTITWEYTDLDWKTHQIQASNFFARAVLHETDHCNGKVFIDHATSVQMLKVNRWMKDANLLR